MRQRTKAIPIHRLACRSLSFVKCSGILALFGEVLLVVFSLTKIWSQDMSLAQILYATILFHITFHLYHFDPPIFSLISLCSASTLNIKNAKLKGKGVITFILPD